MRGLTLSLIIAFTVVLSGVSNAGTSDKGAPNAGLFQINIYQPALVASR